MHARDAQSGGVLARHAQANVAGRHMLGDQDAGWRGESGGPHAFVLEGHEVQEYAKWT